jgi:hypothetical protein
VALSQSRSGSLIVSGEHLNLRGGNMFKCFVTLDQRSERAVSRNLPMKVRKFLFFGCLAGVTFL